MSTSLVLWTPSIPPQAWSPTARRSYTSSRASTRCSTSWTTLNLQCEYMCAERLLSRCRLTFVINWITLIVTVQFRRKSRHQRQQRYVQQYAQHEVLPSRYPYLYKHLFFGFRDLILLFLPPPKDPKYQQILNIPSTGLRLKTKIYVAVLATNLTDRWVRIGVINPDLHAPLSSQVFCPIGRCLPGWAMGHVGLIWRTLCYNNCSSPFCY